MSARPEMVMLSVRDSAGEWMTIVNAGAERFGSPDDIVVTVDDLGDGFTYPPGTPVRVEWRAATWEILHIQEVSARPGELADMIRVPGASVTTIGGPVMTYAEVQPGATDTHIPLRFLADGEWGAVQMVPAEVVRPRWDGWSPQSGWSR